MRLLYDRYIGYLTAVCSRYVVDSAAVKDILQDAFVKVFSKLDGFEYRGEGSLKAWMSRIVVNDSLKNLRGAGRLKYVDELPDTEGEGEIEGMPEVPVRELAEMIKSLPDGYRTVFNLFVFEKKSHREIAGLLGIKEDSSASQLLRAKRLLAKMIHQYKREHDD